MIHLAAPTANERKINMSTHHDPKKTSVARFSAETKEHQPSVGHFMLVAFTGLQGISYQDIRGKQFNNYYQLLDHVPLSRHFKTADYSWVSEETRDLSATFKGFGAAIVNSEVLVNGQGRSVYRIDSQDHKLQDIIRYFDAKLQHRGCVKEPVIRKDVGRLSVPSAFTPPARSFLIDNIALMQFESFSLDSPIKICAALALKKQ